MLSRCQHFPQILDRTGDKPLTTVATCGRMVETVAIRLYVIYYRYEWSE